MGDRGQVCIEDENVWLYTHWSAYDLPETVQKGIKKAKGNNENNSRWSDPEYLARIVFETMIDEDRGGLTGYGIGSSMHGDVWRIVYINCSTQTIRIIDHGEKTVWSGTFDEFADDTHLGNCNKEDEDD